MFIPCVSELIQFVTCCFFMIHSCLNYRSDAFVIKYTNQNELLTTHTLAAVTCSMAHR